jgi:hypothetical protein
MAIAALAPAGSTAGLVAAAQILRGWSSAWRNPNGPFKSKAGTRLVKIHYFAPA